MVITSQFNSSQTPQWDGWQYYVTGMTLPLAASQGLGWVRFIVPFTLHYLSRSRGTFI